MGVTPLQPRNNLSDVQDPEAAVTNLGLDSILESLSDQVATNTGAMLTKASNLADLASLPTALGNLGLAPGNTPTFTNLTLSALPTSNPNIAGRLWNDGGTIKISAG